MNCSTHPEAVAVAFCRSCGKALCAECRRVAAGTVYCAEHAPAAQDAGSATTPGYHYAPIDPSVGTNPRLAFLLGLIPGVGAIYNGQYAKGLVHALIFGVLISILSGGAEPGYEPMVALILAFHVMYMAFEAYHTARRRSLGQPVDEFSGVFHPRGGGRHSSAGALTLIVVGVLFLMNTLNLLELHRVLRFWPVLLILAGVNMLHSRMSDGGPRG
jgi:Domain of unknown function (DUF5668)